MSFSATDPGVSIMGELGSAMPMTGGAVASAIGRAIGEVIDVAVADEAGYGITWPTLGTDEFTPSDAYAFAVLAKSPSGRRAHPRSLSQQDWQALLHRVATGTVASIYAEATRPPVRSLEGSVLVGRVDWSTFRTRLHYVQIAIHLRSDSQVIDRLVDAMAEILLALASTAAPSTGVITNDAVSSPSVVDRDGSEAVRAAWLTYLSPQQIGALGGLAAVEERAPVASVYPIGSSIARGAFLRVTERFSSLDRQNLLRLDDYLESLR